MCVGTMFCILVGLFWDVLLAAVLNLFNGSGVADGAAII